MEERIQQLVAHFKQIHGEYQESSLSPIKHTKEVLKEHAEKEVEPKKKKDETPLMIKKINRHRQELAKNNLKRQQAAFVFHGTIDAFEKELLG